MVKLSKNEVIWAVVKTTDNHKYFDCKLQKKTADGLEQNQITTTSWLAVISGTHNERGNYGRSITMLDRTFINTKSFKDLDEDGKYPVLNEMIAEGTVLEVGFKRTFDFGYHEPPERIYSYYKVKTISKTSILLQKLTKNEMLDIFRGTGFAQIKAKVLKQVNDTQDTKELVRTIGNLTIMLVRELDKIDKAKASKELVNRMKEQYGDE